MNSPVTHQDLHIWNVDDPGASLARSLNCDGVIATLLRMRGIDDHVQAREFLRPGLLDMKDAFDFGGPVPGSEELLRFLVPGAKVVVYGDYDVDGVTSTALGVELALHFGASVRYFIPDRHHQGYGLHEEVIRRIARGGCDLLLVVDCGTKNREAKRVAREEGLPVFIFDHHLPDSETTDEPGIFIVNPHVSGGNTEACRLSAAGVLWVWLLQQELLPFAWLEERLDLVALSTVADCMELGPPNRTLVHEGLQVLGRNRRPGLRALKESLGLSPGLTSEEDVAMRIAPCINAAGRLDLADVAVQVLLAREDCPDLVGRLVSLNRQRQSLSTKIFGTLKEDLQEGRRVFLDSQWPPGVLSGVASRVCHRFSCPVVLAAPVGKGIRGTVRFPRGGNAVDFLEKNAEYLTAWGGHPYAAGFSTTSEQWESLAEEMDEELRDFVVPEEKIEVCSCPPALFSMELWKEMKRLGPFGKGNPSPLFFSSQDLRIGHRRFGAEGKHTSFLHGDMEVIAWNGTAFFERYGFPEGVIYRPRLSFWRGRARLQLLLEYPVYEEIRAGDPLTL